MWVITLLCATFVFVLLNFNVLVKSLREDLGEDPRSCTHVNSTLTTKLVWPTLIISTHTNKTIECSFFVHVAYPMTQDRSTHL
jgi:hypothetical protein